MKNISKYFILAAVVQSVLVGGGYGTGREVVEYFTGYGLWYGLMGLTVAAIGYFLVAWPTLEIARVNKVSDYVDYIKFIIGLWWFLFEILFALLLILILAVIGSASGIIVEDTLGIDQRITTFAMLTIVGILTFWGRSAVVSLLSSWTIVLYAFFIFYFIAFFSLYNADPQSAQQVTQEVTQKDGHWLVSALTYIFYNIVVLPALLYAARDLNSKRETMYGALAIAVLCIVPAILLHITLASLPAEARLSPTPILVAVESLQIAGLITLYMVILFGTFIETGLGLIQGLLERINNAVKERSDKELPRFTRPIFAVVFIGISFLLAEIGVVNLIGKGYTYISWGFFFVYIIPTAIIGYKIILKKTAPN